MEKFYVKFGKNMSRIGKQPINIPENVEVKIENDTVLVKGAGGELRHKIHPEITAEIADKKIVVRMKNENGSTALWGLTRALIANLIVGVSEGFQKKLEIEGVGYRAQVSGDKLVLTLGFSHLIEFPIPKDVTISVDKNTIEVSGSDKYAVGQAAAKIRAFKKPEPYKGKGIHYVGEHIRRKAGKKAATV